MARGLFSAGRPRSAGLDREMARGQEFVRQFNEGDEEARSLARGIARPAGLGGHGPDTPAEALRRIPL